MKTLAQRMCLLAIPLIPVKLAGAEETVLELSAFPVYAGSDVGGAADIGLQLTERMSGDARVDMQTRGGTRYQSDIAIRGGIFEGTGLMVGGLALFDPQTGHYFSEIPLDPFFFSGARLLTGVNNALHGFNSTAGSIDWQWAPIDEGGQISLQGGTDALGGVHLLHGETGQAGTEWQLGGSWEEGDGSVEYGDFSLRRISGRLQMNIGPGRLRLFGGYLAKDYGWPGMYTGFPNLKETEAYHVSLLGWQWETRLEGQAHRVGGYWRQLEDDYEFNRFEPNRLFEHKTEVWSLQGDGHLRRDWGRLAYRWVWLQDRLVRSTSLVEGTFRTRDYGEGGLIASRPLMEGTFVPYAGVTAQSSNRDSTRILPQAGIRMNGEAGPTSWTAYVEWSESSQVPGYTALKSAPQGLFGGNAALGREHAATLEGGVNLQHGGLLMQVVAFQRDDNGLADWVFSRDSPSARQAAAVDIIVRGLETRMRWEGEAFDFEMGYAWLEKDPAYRDMGVDASYYALNYAEHRVLLAAGVQVMEPLHLHLGLEYRTHAQNLLRETGDEALYVETRLLWEAPFLERTDLIFRIENLTKDAFEPVPGTPGPGRTVSVTVRRTW